MSTRYDALTAQVAIVFTRYMILAPEQENHEDKKTLGDLFFLLVDEITEILNFQGTNPIFSVGSSSN